jgi:TPP-dependent pyruvate/acetoin dehydrogenase alpha subunit
MTNKVDEAVDFARAAPFATPESALEDVYTDLVVEGW